MYVILISSLHSHDGISMPSFDTLFAVGRVIEQSSDRLF